jgi:ATP synthase protein I
MDHFQRLQRRIILSTLVAAALAVPVTVWFFGASAAFSLLVGSVAALLYLKLLARSVSRLGVATKSVGKAQLLVPLLLVLAASRLPQLEVLPALVGFLLYKPALIVQALLDG